MSTNLQKRTPTRIKLFVSFLVITCLGTFSGQSLAQQAGPLDLRFQFTQNGFPARHIFQLTWNDENGNPTSINVLSSDNDEIIQQIPLPTDINLTLKNIRDSREKFLETLDYNFDGYADLRVTKAIPYPAGGKEYLVYLYDPVTSNYVLNPAITALQGVIIDEDNKLLITTTFTGRGGTEFTRNFYRIVDGVNLWVKERHIQTVTDPKELTAQLDIRQRVNGELQRVCLIEIPAERQRKIKWGLRRRCAEYLKKPINVIR